MVDKQRFNSYSTIVEGDIMNKICLKSYPTFVEGDIINKNV